MRRSKHALGEQLSDRETLLALAIVAATDPATHNSPEVHELIWKVRDLLRLYKGLT